MILIRKEGLSDELSRKIIEIRKCDKWKNIANDDTNAIRQVFDNDFPKNAVKSVLVREQRGLCAYCMRRIRINSHSRVEHLVPLSMDKEKAIDYNNMFGVCDDGEKVIGQLERILCCDAHKKETKISINPLNKIQMDKIAYKPNGIIYTYPKDAEMEKDVNETLLLNGIKNQDGSVRDTSTEILKGRRDAYDRARLMMKNLNRNGKCTSTVVKKIMESLHDSKEFEEYVGVKLYYFKRKYDALMRRGL